MISTKERPPVVEFLALLPLRAQPVVAVAPVAVDFVCPAEMPLPGLRVRPVVAVFLFAVDFAFPAGAALPLSYAQHLAAAFLVVTDLFAVDVVNFLPAAFL